MRTPSLYDMRPDEIATAERIRRERTERVVEAVVCAPLIVAAIIAVLFI